MVIQQPQDGIPVTRLPLRRAHSIALPAGVNSNACMRKISWNHRSVSSIGIRLKHINLLLDFRITIFYNDNMTKDTRKEVIKIGKVKTTHEASINSGR